MPFEKKGSSGSGSSSDWTHEKSHAHRKQPLAAPMVADKATCAADSVLAADSAPRAPGTGRAAVPTKPVSDY